MSPAPETDIASPTRASCGLRLARSSAGAEGVGWLRMAFKKLHNYDRQHNAQDCFDGKSNHGLDEVLSRYAPAFSPVFCVDESIALPLGSSF